MGSLGAKSLSTLQRQFTWDFEINFLFMKKQIQKYWGQNLGYLGIKQQRLITLHYALFSFFFLRQLGYWGIFALLQSRCCLRMVYNLGICPSWTEYRGHLSCAAALTQGQGIPPCHPCFSGSSTSLAVTTRCWVMQPFVVTAAASHPSPAPFIRNRLCGSSPRLPVLLSSVECSWYHCYDRKHLP